MNIKSKSALLSGLAATVVLIGASPAPGSGTDGGETGIVVQPNPAAGDVSTAMLTALQPDLNVTAEQAMARLIRADWHAIN